MIRNAAISMQQIPIDVHINMSVHRCILITTVFYSIIFMKINDKILV